MLVWVARALACVFFIWPFWRTLVAVKPDIDAPRQNIAERAVDKAVGELRTNAGDIHNVTMYHFENDPSDYVSDSFRKKLEKQGGLTLRGKRFSDRLRDFMGLSNDGVATRKEAIEASKGSPGTDAVLWGRIDRLENERKGSTIIGEYELYDLKRDCVAYAGKIRESSVPGRFDNNHRITDDDYAAGGDSQQLAARTPWHIRFLWFIIVMLLLPVVTISFIRTMVAKKSNGVNAFVLGVYTTVDLILAFFMVGGSLSSFFSVVMFLLAGIVAFLYNVKIMTFAVRLEG